MFEYSSRALGLVWSTNRTLSITLAVLTLIAGVLPAGVAFIGAQIVDAVIHAADLHHRTGTTYLNDVVRYVALEALLVAATAMAQRGISLAQSLLRAQLGQRVNVMILEKALTLDLTQFEDSEFYDKLTRARREASSRPLSLVMRTFALGQNAVSLISFGGLLYRFSPWAVLLLILAGLPAFLAEAKFSGEAFRLFRWRAPESRMQIYLESVLAREDYAKEVKLFDLGKAISRSLPRHFHPPVSRGSRPDLAPRRLGLWVGTARNRHAVRRLRLDRRGNRAGRDDRRPNDHVPDAVPAGSVSGQRGVVGGQRPVRGQSVSCRICSSTWNSPSGAATSKDRSRIGPDPGDGIRFEDVEFVYPGAAAPALSGINLHVRPGESLALVGQNGSGKTTLIKLLTRLYEPTRGRVLARRARS